MTWNAHCRVEEVSGDDGGPVDVRLRAAKSDVVQPYPNVPAQPAVASNTEGEVLVVEVTLRLAQRPAKLEVGQLLNVSGHFDA